MKLLNPRNDSPRRESSLLIVLAAAVMFSVSAGADTPPTLTVVEGNVEIGSGEPPAWRSAATGDTLQPGDVIRTSAGGRVELELGDDKVRMYENSVLRLPQAAFGAKHRAVELEKGRSLFDVFKRRSGDSFEVRTPEAVVMVKGTRFAVDVAGRAAAVSVFHGLVGVRSIVGTLQHEVLVRPGFTAVGGADRSFELLLDRAPDPWSGWRDGGAARDALDRRVQERMEQPPAKIAAEQARAATREMVSKDVLVEAVDRNPKLREALAANPELAKRKMMMRAMHHERRAEHKEMKTSGPDAVSDNPHAGMRDRLSNNVMDEMMEQWTGGGPPPTPPGGFDPLILNVVSGSGGPGTTHIEFIDSATGVIIMDLPMPAVMNILNNVMSSMDPNLFPVPIKLNYLASGMTLQDYVALLQSTIQ